MVLVRPWPQDIELLPEADGTRRCYYYFGVAKKPVRFFACDHCDCRQAGEQCCRYSQGNTPCTKRACSASPPCGQRTTALVVVCVCFRWDYNYRWRPVVIRNAEVQACPQRLRDCNLALHAGDRPRDIASSRSKL